MILLPYAHERQTVQRLPWITFGLIALNVVIFLVTQYTGTGPAESDQYLFQFSEYLYNHPYLNMPDGMQKFYSEKDLQQIELLKEASNTTDIPQFVIDQEQAELNRLASKVLTASQDDPFRKYGYVPAEPRALNLITCMFLHTGWLHLIGNMFFLYLAGCSIEDLWGRPLYSAFYLIGGIAATLTHELKFGSSDVPLVGASGAIAALMGAFLVRLYNTKISFFYMLGLWYRGTFKAPAFIMLPLWLLQQLWDAALVGEAASVAFWAHIGGFIFGAVFALGMKYARIEEKFISPAIEKKVSLAQNPDFLRAMELSERGAFPEALILLERVVRQEPNHLDAYMEMRRIAEINKDYPLYSKYSGAIFDILIRNRDWEFLMELYGQFCHSPFRQPLPARTLFGLAGYFEEAQDFNSALEHYEELIRNYSDDPLAMKGSAKLARLYIDKLGNQQRAAENLGKAFHHKLATDQWRNALQAEAKRYNVTIPEEEPPAAMPVMAAPDVPIEPAAVVPVQESEPAAEKQFDELVGFADEPDPRRIEPPLGDAERVVLPNTAFDGIGDRSWLVVPCRIEKIQLKGIHVRNRSEIPGFLPWKKIQFLSAGRIRMMDSSGAQQAKDTLVIDIIATVPQAGGKILYRVFGHELAFEKIFPRVEQTFEEAYQNFVGILLTNSGANPIPNRDSCTGPRFASHLDLQRYESRLKEKLAPDSGGTQR